MALSQEDVLHLAALARLELTPDEVELYQKQLGDVLSYVAQLQELDTRSTAMPQAATPLRTDKVELFFEPGRLVAAAPEHDDSFVVVPPVFGESR